MDAPLRFPLIDGFTHAGYRRRIHGRYIIVYVVGDYGIGVVRVISSAMDLAKVLG